MAADGGFSTKPMGFDKNEVNEYISSLRKRMNEIEAEKKENDNQKMTGGVPGSADPGDAFSISLPQKVFS